MTKFNFNNLHSFTICNRDSLLIFSGDHTLTICHRYVAKLNRSKTYMVSNVEDFKSEVTEALLKSGEFNLDRILSFELTRKS